MASIFRREGCDRSRDRPRNNLTESVEGESVSDSLRYLRESAKTSRSSRRFSAHVNRAQIPRAGAHNQTWLGRRDQRRRSLMVGSHDEPRDRVNDVGETPKRAARRSARWTAEGPPGYYWKERPVRDISPRHDEAQQILVPICMAIMSSCSTSDSRWWIAPSIYFGILVRLRWIMMTAIWGVTSPRGVGRISRVFASWMTTGRHGTYLETSSTSPVHLRC